MGAGSSAVMDHAEPAWDFTALAASASGGERPCRCVRIGFRPVRDGGSRRRYDEPVAPIDAEESECPMPDG